MFCCNELVSKYAIQASTMNFNSNVQLMATELGDRKLLEKQVMGNMRAVDAVYHKTCMILLYISIDLACQLHLKWYVMT